MLFGESQFKSPKKTNVLNLRQLLPLALLLAIGGLLLSLGKLPWGGQPGGPAGSDDVAATTSAVVDDLMVPMEPADPAPFEEKPEVLFRAASLDRTAELSEEAIVYLFQKIRVHPEAFRSEEPVLSLERDDTVWRKLIDDPDMYRGRVVELSGRVLSSEPGRYPVQLKGLEFPNPSGLDRRFETFVVGIDQRIYKVTTFSNARELSNDDAVRLRAYFLGLYTNQVEHRGKLTLGTVPVLVGEDFVPIEGPAAEGTDASIYLPLVFGLSLVAFAVVFFLHLRTERTYQRRRLAARAARGRSRTSGRGRPEDGAVHPAGEKG